MTSGCWNEPGKDADQVVVHVSRVAQGCRRGGHDGGHEGVGLRDGGDGDFEAVDGDPIESGVVEDHDGVCVLCEALQREQGVVGLHDDVAGFVLVWEHGVGLDDLFGKAIVEALEQVGARA